MRGATLFVGVGSPHGDDRAGWLVADALHEMTVTDVFTRRSDLLNTGATAVVQSPPLAIRKACIPADLLDWLDGVARLIVCDAVCGAGPTGTLHRWFWPDPRIGQMHSAGSHDFGLPAVLELAGTLGRLPAVVVAWGIEAGQVLPDAEVSPEIQRALPDLVARIHGELVA
jgi:hydrogenase maturation protease